MSLAGKPAEYYILPDTKLVGPANVVSATSQRGPYPGPVTPSANNAGLVYPVQSGELTDEATGIRYVVSRAGGLGVGEFGWRRSGDATDQFRGWDDSRHVWGHHAAFTTSVGSDNCAAVYCAPFRRLLVVNADDSTATTTVLVRYRDVDADRYDEWTETSFDLDNAVASGHHNIRLVDLPGGELLMVVRTTVDGDTDFDCYRSADGGLTWRLVSEALLSAFARSAFSPDFDLASQFSLARSGEHIRVCWMTSTAEVRTFLSTDRGISWAKIPNLVGTYYATGATDDPIPFGLLPVDDAGTFLLIGLAAADTLIAHSASAGGEWVFVGNPQAAPQAILAIACVRTPAYLWLYTYWAEVGASAEQGWQFARCRPAGYLDVLGSTDQGWEYVDEAQRYSDTGIKYAPSRLSAVWAGDRVFVYGARRDKSASYADVNFPSGWYHGGWTRRSLWRARPTKNLSDLSAPLWQRFWTVEAGDPTEPAGSSWTTTGSGTFAATQNELQIDTTSGNPLRFVRTIAASGGPAWGQDNDAIFVWEVKTGTGDGSVTADEAAVRVISQNDANTTQLDVSVRMGPAGLRVYDNVAGSALDTISSVAFDSGAGASGRFFEVRFAMWRTGGGAHKAQAAVLDLDTGEWSVGAEVTLTSTAAAGSCIVRFGGLDAPASGTTSSFWRMFAIGESHTAHQRDFENPTSLVGYPLTASPGIALSDGLSVSWGGIGGALIDVFDGSVSYAHGAGQIAADSPRLDWRSTSQAAQTIILDADPENGVGRWVHDAIAVFGANDREVLVDYDSDPAFGSPTSTETIDLTAYGTGAAPLVAVSTVGTTLLVVVPSGAAFVAGELVGCYARATTGAAAGKTWRITRHDQRATLAFDEELSALSAQGLSAGDELVVFSPSGAKVYGGGLVNQRYMRLRFADTDTAEGYHRCGTIVVGTRQRIEVPIDWARTDNAQPNLSSYRSRGAITWMVVEGPPQRTWSGRIVGDAIRAREKLRGLIASIGYEARPIAWIFDDERPVERAALVRFQGGSQLDDAGVYRDADDVIRGAGDQTISLVEEV